MERPFFTIVIATYNSEKTLEYTLQSIRNQHFDQDQIEILVVDGGSTDKTRNIAKHYGAIILDNPKRLPEYAKTIGIKNAKGLYVVRMDSDEEFSYPDQLAEKAEVLKKYPDIKMLIPNVYLPGRKEICGVAAAYMNFFGDPFSYFVYRTRKDKCETYRDNIVKWDGNLAIMQYAQDDIYPLADSATSVLSLDFIKDNYAKTYDSIQFTCSAYDIVLRDTGICGCIKRDNIFHNCASSFKTYLSKLRFRVINNLFHKEESGFSSKEGANAKMKRRKLLFCLYAAIIPVPILDSIRLAISYRDITFLLHFVYLYYVCLLIVKYGVIKLMGGSADNKGYGTT